MKYVTYRFQGKTGVGAVNEALDAVFLTHTDGDHAGGLWWLSESDIPVGAWYAPAYYTGVKDEKHPAVKAALARGQSVQWLRRGDSVPLGDTGAVLRVLAPDRLFEDKDNNWYQLLTISFLLYISACYTPLPGASGAQEGGFLLYYDGIIPGDRIGLALLVWRFFTYYMFLIVGVVDVILDKVLISMENRRKKQKIDGQP